MPTVLVAVLALAGLTAAAPAPTGAAPAAHLRDAARVAPTQGLASASTPTGGLAGGPLTRDRVLAAVQDRLTAGGPRHVALATLDVLDALPDVRSVLADEDHGRSTADLAEAAAASGVEFAGDLDGDDLADLVTGLWRTAEDGTPVARLGAVRGLDGAPLWSVDVAVPAGGDWWPYVIPDVTGDGAADILETSWVHVHSSSSTCDDDGCTSEERSDIASDWTIRSGADGSVVGTRSVDGWSAGRTEDHRSDGLTESSSSSRWEYRTENAPTWPMVVGDQDGDGAADLLWVALSATFEYAASGTSGPVGLWSASEERYVSEGTVDARILDAGGGGIHHVGGGDATGTGWISPLGAPGVPAALLVQVEPDRSFEQRCSSALLGPSSCEAGGTAGSRQLVVLEPVTFAERFRVSGDDAYGWPWPDATGDGVWDIVTGDGLRSGADGSMWEPLAGRELWGHLGRTSDGRPVLVTGSFDVETEACGTLETADVMTLELVRLDGSTGDELAVSRHEHRGECGEGDRWWPSLFASAVGDHDGDGVTDLTIVGERTGRPWYDVLEVVGALGGRLAGPLEGMPYPVGDVDGDGDDDLNLYGREDGEVVVGMPGGELLWTVGTDGAVWQSADVDGDRAAEVLVSRGRYEDGPEDGTEGSGTVTSWFELAGGSDGVVRWRTAPVTYEFAYLTTEG